MSDGRDIVERLNEPVIAVAFSDHRIRDGVLAERLIKERHDAAQTIERLRRVVVDQMLLRDHENIMASVAVGSWLSAALEDPNVCKEMKLDIRAWFAAGQPTAPRAEVEPSPTPTREDALAQFGTDNFRPNWDNFRLNWLARSQKPPKKSWWRKEQ